MSEPGRYRLKIAGPAARALSISLPEKIATAVYEVITGDLLENPRRVGKPLDPPQAPLWVTRRGSYRIFYLIDDVSRAVEVVAIHHPIRRVPFVVKRACWRERPPAQSRYAGAGLA